MYAVIRRISFCPDVAQHADDLEHFRIQHESQPGFLGTLDIDEGNGHHVVVNLWDTEAAAEAGRRVIGALAAQTMQPITNEPPELLAAGNLTTTVVIDRPHRTPGVEHGGDERVPDAVW